jgi:hypothetical protein
MASLDATPWFANTTLTPLLASGDDPRWSELHTAKLPDGGDATVVQCSLLRPSLAIAMVSFGFADGYRAAFRLAVTHVPESIGFVPNLLCHPRTYAGARAAARLSTGVLADKAAGLGPEYHRVKVGDRDFERRYNLKADADVGRNWITQLFSPGFIRWCVEEPLSGFGFELTSGWLIGFVSTDGSTGVREYEPLIVATSKVAAALRDEALEEKGLAAAGYAARSDRGRRSRPARRDRAVDEVVWQHPPPSEKAARRPYLWRGLRRPRPWAAAIITALLPGLLGVVWVASAPGDAWGWVWLALSACLAVSVFWHTLSQRAGEIGRAAFALGYADRRHLEREDPRLFQARSLSVRLTGVVNEALTGNLPGGIRGTLVFLHGTGKDAGSFYEAIVAPATDDAATEVEEILGPAGRSVREGKLVIWQVTDTAGRTNEGIDEFCEFVAREYGDVIATAP